MKNPFLFIGISIIAISFWLSACDGENRGNSDACSGEDGVMYVNSTGGSDSNAGTRTAPKKTIQAGISCAESAFTSGEVHVSEGSYSTSGEINEMTQASAGIVLKEGISAYGGYSATDWDARNPLLYPSIVYDESSGDTGYFENPNRAFHAGSDITPATVLDGFTIDGGNGDYTSAVTCAGGSPTISNNSIAGGSGSSTSYGVYVSDGSPVISGNTISGGDGGVYTDGIACDYAAPVIQGNTIYGGSGSSGSRGIDSYYSNAVVRANTINGGVSGGASFGIMMTGGSCSIYNNVINGQGSSVLASYGVYFGAALDSGTPLIANNTINAGNGSNSSTGITITNSNPEIVNNIIVVRNGLARYGIAEEATGTEADPSSLANNDVYLAAGGSFGDLYRDSGSVHEYTVICSGNFGESGCVHTLSTPAGTGNVSLDPMLGSGSRLTVLSPETVSRGGSILSSFTTDFDGAKRTAPWSMGAFEQD